MKLVRCRYYRNNADIASDYTPEDDAVYQITAIGSCQGIRKVIRKTILRVISAVLAVVTAAVRKHWNYQVWYRLTVL